MTRTIMTIITEAERIGTLGLRLRAEFGLLRTDPHCVVAGCWCQERLDHWKQKTGIRGYKRLESDER